MWTLPKPDNRNALDDLVTALRRADGTWDYLLSVAERRQVSALYQRHEKLKGQPSAELTAPDIQQALKIAIQAAYNQVQQGKRLSKLRDRLKLAAARCPVCSIGPVTHLDHHLPQVAYGALSIYSRNLVPMCETCNNRKRAHAPEGPAQQLVHPYFDIVPNEQFLVADINVVSGAILADFRVRKTQGMSSLLFERLKFQVERQQLSVRYRSEVNVFLASQEISFSDAFGVDESSARLRDFLLRSSRAMDRNFGLNDWRSALLRGLSNNQQFCEGAFRDSFKVSDSIT
jgi:hypothetical protein